MAGESCNVKEDEAEILKPSSSSSSSPCPTSPCPPPTSPSPSHSRKPPLQDLPAPERLEHSEPSSAAAICSPQKPEEESSSSPPQSSTNRCLICRKRLGLTSFRCRCGELFCPGHRYSETHDCSFDYKAAGREQIARANPLIRAAKIIKI